MTEEIEKQARERAEELAKTGEGQEQYDALQREIISCEQELKKLEKQARERAEKLEENQTLGVYDNEEDLARDISWNDGQVNGYEEGFIDGAKWGIEHAIGWHDLRKNAGDLPHDETLVLVINNFDSIQYYLGYFDKFHGNWLSERMLKLFDVIAWCELPKFEE